MAWLLAALFVVGTLAAALRPPLRPALLPALVTLILLAASAALVGDVPRYRYPLDPFIYVVAAGGLTTMVALAWSLVRRRPLPRPLPETGRGVKGAASSAPPSPLPAGERAG